MKDSLVNTYCVIEYPGIVENPEEALKTLGGIGEVRKAFLEVKPDLELFYRYKDYHSHPIKGKIFPSKNVVLKLCVTKIEGDSPGTYTTNVYVQIVGIAIKTCLFRALSDYQYLVDQNDPLFKLRESMRNMDLNGVEQFKFSKDFRPQNERFLFPPSHMTRLECSLPYNFLQVANTEKSDTKDGDYNHPKPLSIYRERKFSVSLNDEVEQTPQSPPREVLLSAPEEKKYSDIVAKLRKIFDERPIWLRSELVRKFPELDLPNIRELLAQVAYSIYNGAWRGCWIRYKYNPRASYKSSIYQSINVFLGSKKPRRARSADNQQEKLGSTSGSRHPFVSVQLIDILDKESCELITNMCKKKPYNKKYGWFTSIQYLSLRESLKKEISSRALGHEFDMINYKSLNIDIDTPPVLPNDPLSSMDMRVLSSDANEVLSELLRMENE